MIIKDSPIEGLLPKGHKCIYCHWYKYNSKTERCYGFTQEDINECIKLNFMYFRGRQPKQIPPKSHIQGTGG